jgi:hypothetical protein
VGTGSRSWVKKGRTLNIRVIAGPGHRSRRARPDVPFCAPLATATTVVLSRRSVRGGMREIADYALLNDTARAVILCAREPNVLGHPSYRWE